jgi:hypothetical protein
MIAFAPFLPSIWTSFLMTRITQETSTIAAPMKTRECRGLCILMTS